MGINKRLDKLEEKFKERQEKPKKFRIPWKAKVGNKKMGEGYSIILKLEENKNADFTKEKITDGTIKIDDTFHAVNPDDIFFYKGKPLIVQCKNKLNPYNPLKDKNETYGQKYIMARMEGDKLTLKKKLGWGIGIGMMIIIGIIAYSVLFGA